jgi:hypothetical protein
MFHGYIFASRALDQSKPVVRSNDYLAVNLLADRAIFFMQNDMFSGSSTPVAVHRGSLP